MKRDWDLIRKILIAIEEEKIDELLSEHFENDMLIGNAIIM